MIWIACLFLSGGLGDDPFQDPLKEEPDVEFLDGLFMPRIGVWGSGGFEFEAVRADGKRELNGRGLVFAGGDIGAVFEERVMLFATYEYCEGGDLNIEIIGITLGYRTPLESSEELLPTRLDVYAGAIFGAIEVEVENFGRVADDWGFRAGLAPVWDFGGGVAISLFLELRIIDFEYRSAILSGDDQIGGSGAAAGLSLEIRF